MCVYINQKKKRKTSNGRTDSNLEHSLGRGEKGEGSDLGTHSSRYVHTEIREELCLDGAIICTTATA